MRLAVLLLLLTTPLAACETMAGAGRDLQSAGQAISTEARQAQSRL